MLVLGLLLQAGVAAAAQQPAPAVQLPVPSAAGAIANPTTASPLTPLGPGDSVTLHVFGQPDMDSVLAVADDGTIRVPLAGSVQVGGVSADEAARRVEKEFKDGGYFLSPHVSLTVTQSLSQRISVLGEVRAPGRYPIDSKTTILDLLAQAGGQTELASNTVFILRNEAGGGVKRYPVTLQGLTTSGGVGAGQALRAGDSVFVPRAEQFYILGEVQKPSMYKLEANLTVIQAISIAGGVTPKGSDRRVEIKRVGKDGKEVIIKPKPNDLVEPDDVIRVKESIF
jgi:polysaccharide export outer membrane protein